MQLLENMAIEANQWPELMNAKIQIVGDFTSALKISLPHLHFQNLILLQKGLSLDLTTELSNLNKNIISKLDKSIGKN